MSWVCSFVPRREKTKTHHNPGHAFGLFHEHQRTDAYKNNLVFTCKNLADYDNFKNIADNNMDTLCNNYFAAARAGFSASEFIPLPEAGYYQGGAFDMDSLMRYGAEYGGKPQFFGRKRKTVLSRADGQPLADPVTPSAGDIARLRALYP
jgi:hypothetical protein